MSNLFEEISTNKMFPLVLPTDNHSDEDAARLLSLPAPPAQLSEQTCREPNCAPGQLLRQSSHTRAAQILLYHTIGCGEFKSLTRTQTHTHTHSKTLTQNKSQQSTNVAASSSIACRHRQSLDYTHIHINIPEAIHNTHCLCPL